MVRTLLGLPQGVIGINLTLIFSLIGTGISSINAQALFMNGRVRLGIYLFLAAFALTLVELFPVV